MTIVHDPRPCRGLVRAGALVAFGMVWFIGEASAHDPYTEFMTPFGVPCCNGEDCMPLQKGDVEIRSDGYYIRSRQEFVPLSDAQVGPDDGFHICAFHGLRMCFLVPRAGS